MEHTKLLNEKSEGSKLIFVDR